MAHLRRMHPNGKVPGTAFTNADTRNVVGTARRERDAQNSARAAVESHARFMDFSKEARKIWNSTPTPVFDAFTKELRGNSPHGEFPPDGVPQSVFDKYQEILTQTYPKCRTGVVAIDLASGTVQPYEASHGWNYYNKLGEVERLCNNGGKNLINIESELRQAFVNAEMARFIAQRNEQTRFSQVPTGNLLGLDEPEIPNLLRFEPTKEGLNAREEELAGLFGGGKKRNTRKSTRRRKNRRMHTRAVYKK